ncbi:MAG: zinc-binding dehydrogenase [Phycisphaerales bacterium]
MRAIVLTKQGSPVAGNVEVRDDWADPGDPGAGEVRVRTLASAFNHMDIWVGAGLPGATLEFPRISGADGCGVVEAVGAGVDQAWVGRRVVVNAAIAAPVRARPGDPPPSTLAPSYHLLGETIHGMHRAAFCVPVDNVADVGDTDPAEAAAFGLAFLTAWSMLVTKAQLRAGQSVLITGIGGGVATAALAIARHFGCPTIVTSRHQWKLDKAGELGATHGVLDQGSDTGEDWSREVRTLTGKRGVDVAVDSIGRATHLSCIKALARGGAYVTCGCTTGPAATTDLARIFWNQLRVLGSTMGSPAEFGEVVSLLRSGALRPVVDRVYTPEEAPAAYARLESGEQFGKLVIRWAAG